MAEIQSTILGANNSMAESTFASTAEAIAAQQTAAQQIFMSSSAASQAAVESATAATTKPPLVQMVDSIWNGVAGVFSYLIPDFNPILDFGVGTLVAAQAATGLSWSAIFFLFGVSVRLSTLFFTMYGERASLRMQVALPEIKKAYHRFEIVYYDPASTQKEMHQVSTQLQEEQAKVYRKHGTSNLRALASLVSGPVFVYGFWVAMRTAGLAAGVPATAFAWIPSLTQPDPYCVLPVTVVGLTVLNFELFFAKKGGSKGTGISSNIVNGIRIVAVSCMWAISNFRAAVLLYWAGVSLTGLLQPALMRNPAFQKWWGVPTDDQMKRAVEQAREATLAAHAATVGKKSPSQTFIEKLKEQRQSAKSGVAAPSPSAASRHHDSSSSSFGAATTDSAAATVSAPSSDLENHDQKQQQQQARASYNIRRSASPAPSYEDFLKSSSSSSGTAASPASFSSSSPQSQPSGQQPTGPAYRILKASQLEEKQRKDAEAAADDPLLQRLMMTMPMMSQSIVNPEKNQQLADDIQNFNEKQMEEARKTRSWKSKTK